MTTVELEVQDCPMPASTIQAILSSPVPYGDETPEEDAAGCEKIVDTLTEEQLEEAAQASYAYWLQSITKQATPEQRKVMATREVRRHYYKMGPEKATAALLETIAFRKNIRIDLLRACFLPGANVIDSDDVKTLNRYHGIIMEELVQGQVRFIRGVDQAGHALMIVRSRLKAPVDDEAFIVTQIYLMERAIACTEYLSQGKMEKVTVVLDLGSSSSSTSPSWKALHQSVLNLQYCYPERLKRLVVCDPPFFIRTTYNLLTPFMHQETRQKFVMVSGNEQKTQALSETISDDQAMPFMLPSGKLTSEVDIERFIKQVPFHSLYDDSEETK